MSEKAHDVVIKLFAVLLAVVAIWFLFTQVAAGGFLRGMGVVLLALLGLATALGFARRRGWAFLVVSVGLLLDWMTCFILMVVSFDRGGFAAGRGWLAAWILTMVLIGYFGRWSMERRFRPHLEGEH